MEYNLELIDFFLTSSLRYTQDFRRDTVRGFQLPNFTPSLKTCIESCIILKIAMLEEPSQRCRVCSQAPAMSTG